MLQFLLLKPAVWAAATGGYLVWRKLHDVDWRWPNASERPEPPRPEPPRPEPQVQLVQCGGCSKAVPREESRWAPKTPELTWRELEGWLCPVCWKEKGEPLERRYLQALEVAKDIEAYPKTFKTRLPIDWQRGGREVTSRWEMNKADCEWQLRVAAAFLGFDVIVEVHEDKQPYGSRPVRTTFQLKGTARYLARESRRRRW